MAWRYMDRAARLAALRQAIAAGESAASLERRLKAPAGSALLLADRAGLGWRAPRPPESAPCLRFLGKDAPLRLVPIGSAHAEVPSPPPSLSPSARPPLRRRSRDLLDYDREELEERVRQLEAILFDASWIPAAWRITGAEATILNVLAERRLASRDGLHLALYGDRADGGPDPKIIDVLICKLRPKVEPHGIGIETRWGQGFELSAAARRVVSALRGGADPGPDQLAIGSGFGRAAR